MTAASGASSGEKPSRGEPIFVVLVVSIVLVVLVSTVALDFPSPAQSAAVPKGDGPTFYQALASINASISHETGGPWHLFSVYGIAAQSPFSANGVGFINSNQTINACGEAFNGLTLWNGSSIPTFTGDFASGTAPFWQFVYYSIASEQILVSTNLMGVPKVFPPISVSSPCAEASTLTLVQNLSFYSRMLAPLPLDSPALAQLAWNSLGNQWEPRNQPGVEIYTLGRNILYGLGEGGINIYYTRCGEIGAAGIQNIGIFGSTFQGGWVSDNGSVACSLLPSFGSNGFEFGAPSTSAAAGTTWISLPYQVAVVYPNGSLSENFDAQGLVTWLTSLNLSNGTGTRLSSAMASCGSWVPSVSSCLAQNSGWFAVLLSSSGQWMDSYPSSPNGTSWEVPNVPIVSNQQIVIVIPSSWNPAGDQLTVTGTTPSALIGGTTPL